MSKLQKWFLIIVTVLVALAVTLLIENGFAPVYDIFTTGEKADFEFADVYSRIPERKPYHGLSNVVVVASDGCDDRDLAALLNALDSLQVRVIGLDINFQGECEDSTLFHAISHLRSNIVLPCILDGYDENSKKFSSIDTAFFSAAKGGSDRVRFGSVTLCASKMEQKVRRFRQEYRLQNDNSSVQSFATAITEAYSPDKYAELVSRDTETHDNKGELITYGGVDIETVSWNEIVARDSILCLNADSPFVADSLLKDKVVLIGDVGNVGDRHNTPFGEKAGVVIHAYTVDTMLNSRYVTDFPNWLNILIATIATLLFVWGVVYFRTTSRYRHTGRAIVRLVQLLLIAVFFGFGYWLFLHKWYINFSISILMIGSSVIALDFVTGVFWIIQRWWNKKFHPGKAAVCCMLAVICSVGCASAKVYVADNPAPKDVKIKVNGEWKPLKADQSLNYSDELLFENKGSIIKLKDTKNKGTYTWCKNGAVTVGKLINDCKNGKSPECVVKISGGPDIGVSIRKFPKRREQMSSTVPFEYELAAFIIDYIANDTTKFGAREPSVNDLVLRKHGSVEEFVMSVANNDATTGYFVNVICENRTTRQIGVCYNVDVEDDNGNVCDRSMWVDAQTEASFPDLRFVDNDDCDFYLIASTEEFSWGLLQKILDDKDARRVPYDATQFRMCRMSGK